jgi:hypothetical protein
MFFLHSLITALILALVTPAAHSLLRLVGDSAFVLDLGSFLQA